MARSPYGADVPADRLVAELPLWAWPVEPEPAPLHRTPVEPPPLADSPFVWEAVPEAAPDRGEGGPLGGLRLAVKDLIAVAGHPVRAGSASRQAIPVETTDAPIVATLLGMGARLVGATRLHELAFGVTGVNRFEGTAVNPADAARAPGGSSSGSAVAVALGLADVALGTDTGGSARIPAALCGVVGYKASRRLTPIGVLPLAPSLDHLGWCVASVEVARRTAAALGLVATDRPARRRPRIGVLTSSLDTASAEVAGPVRQALARLQQAGFELTDLHWPHTDLVAAVSTTVMFAEAAHSHLASLEGDPNSIGADVRGRLLRGRSIGATAYLAGRQLVDQLSALFSAFFQQVDVVAGPTTRIAAPLLSEADDPGVAAALVRYTRLDDLTGFPAMSLPVATAGLPVGMHLTGLTDEGLLDAAAALERVVSGPRSR